MRPPIHLGKILAEELEEIAVTPTELARQLRVQANRITQIVQGKRAVTRDTALRLGPLVRQQPAIWLNLQAAYDLSVALESAGLEIAKLPNRRSAN